MNTGRFIRDRLPAMFIRAAAVLIIILFMYSYRVSYGLIIAVMIVAAAAEAVTLIIDYLKRKPFYDTLENSLVIKSVPRSMKPYHRGNGIPYRSGKKPIQRWRDR